MANTMKKRKLQLRIQSRRHLGGGGCGTGKVPPELWFYHVCMQSGSLANGAAVQ